MDRLFKLNGAQRHQNAVDEWLASEPQALFSLARHWFDRIRDCGPDVQELLHDGCPVACVENAAFIYVNVFSHHVNMGFYSGATLDDPTRLLEGTGKHMRHVKVRPGQDLDSQALDKLIAQAYTQIKNALDQR